MGPEFDHDEIDLITALAIAIVAGQQANTLSGSTNPGEVFDVAEEVVRERRRRYFSTHKIGD